METEKTKWSKNAKIDEKAIKNKEEQKTDEVGGQKQISIQHKFIFAFCIHGASSWLAPHKPKHDSKDNRPNK